MTDKKKPIFYTELSYILGLIILALGTALMEWGDFGMSMVVAPAYLLHLKLSQFWPVFTFGMAEYMTQAVVLVLLALVMKKFKPIYLFSFVTAVLYGVLLDVAIHVVSAMPLDQWLVALGGQGGLVLRVVVYSFGLVIATLSIAMLFQTYIAPEAYELFVKELSEKTHQDIGKVKTIYDCVSCIVAILLSFVFFGFGHFEGIKIGTILITIVNCTMISFWGKMLYKVFRFEDALSFRKYFQ